MSQLLTRITKFIKLPLRRLIRIVDDKPLLSLFSALFLLFMLIIIGNFLRQPVPVVPEAEPVVKTVELYSIGSVPKIKLGGKVEKSGVLTLTAGAGGFVQKIYVQPGAAVKRGQQLFWLSSNATGGTLPSINRQIAEKNYQLTIDTFETQKELLGKRWEIAEKSDAQTDELREITHKSLDDTRNLISLNEQMLSSLDTQLNQLMQNNTGGTNDAAILQTQQAKAGVLSGLNSLRTALRSSEYQVSGDQEPAQLSNLSRELTLKQLELEEKSLDLTKEISKLNLTIASISESMMYPASPCNGVVERVQVAYGQSVNPGTVLANIKCAKSHAQIIVPVLAEVAAHVSRIEKSILALPNGENVESAPLYVSTEPTEGNLHSILFELPDMYTDQVSDGAFVTVSVPVGEAHTTAVIPFVPLYSIYQTQNEAYVLVAEKTGEQLVAATKTVRLGVVQGSYVEVTDGLGEGDQVIVDRNVIAGDVVAAK